MPVKQIRLTKKGNEIIVRRLVKEVVKTGKAQSKQDILDLILKESEK